MLKGRTLGRLTIIAVLAVSGALGALLAGGCGSPSLADQALNAAVDDYNYTVNTVSGLDLKTASQAEIKTARAQLKTAWNQLEEKSRKAGQDTADALRAANDRMGSALSDAAALPANARDQAAAALQSASDALSSAIKSAWNDVKDLLK
jgi:hypothetical protein